MAKTNFELNTEGEVALAATTAKTVLQVRAPTNQRVAVSGWHVSFDDNTIPVRVQVMRQTTDGTMTTATARKQDDDIATTLQSTGGKTATAEPTSGEILKDIVVQGGYEEQRSYGKEFLVGGGDRIGIVCTADAIVNVQAHLDCEE